MRSVSKKTGVSKKVARDRRILAKARREDRDSAEVTIMRGDVDYMVGELRQVFEAVLDADDCPDGGSRDVCVLSALRRLRTVQIMLDVPAAGGAS